jgi:hypothetical protein
MAWYFWVLIIIGVVLIGAAKMAVFKKIMEKRKAQRPVDEED